MTVEMISHLLEALMILCFGLSWPLSIYKSWTSRTAKITVDMVLYFRNVKLDKKREAEK